MAEVAAAHSVSWPTAHRAFVAHAATLLAEPTPVSVLGIDETRRGRPRWQRCLQSGRWVRLDPWDTGFVDLSGNQGLLSQAEGRTAATVVAWLRERSEAFRAGVAYVAIDPAAGYASAVRHRIAARDSGRGSFPPRSPGQRHRVTRPGTGH